MMQLSKTTYQQQSDLAHYCRSNDLSDNLEARIERVYHYRRLVFNVIDDSLQSAFPLTHNLLDEHEWEVLVNEFFSEHDPHSPQLWKMPGEFFEYYEQKSYSVKSKYPFLSDLLAFEWAEVRMFMMEDRPYPDYADEGDWMTDPLAFNPESEILKVGYPVHLKKTASITTEDKSDYYILMFRERDTGKVQFFDLSAIHVWTIENLQTGRTLEELLPELTDHLKNMDPFEIKAQLLGFLQKMRSKGFVAGFLTCR